MRGDGGVCRRGGSGVGKGAVVGGVGIELGAEGAEHAAVLQPEIDAPAVSGEMRVNGFDVSPAMKGKMTVRPCSPALARASRMR